MNKINLTGVIDMHVHSAPDIRKRSLNDIQLSEEAERVGARAIVIKSHLVPTMDRAWLVNQMNPAVTMFGSITLNESVGGINPYAVETALNLGAKVVWMPTVSSTKHRELTGQSGGIETVKGGKVIPPLVDVLKLIAEKNAVLATGHLSSEEIFVVVEEARKQGVEKIVVTHPEFFVVNMSIQEQKRIVADYQVYLERCYAQPIGGGKYKSNLADNLRAIEEVGYESTIVSTDGGQVENPIWSQALTEYIQYLADHGVPNHALDMMTKETPAKLLDLEIFKEGDLKSSCVESILK
ncbi:DUF6282 family protein [Ectobacillus funiculus]|uniref:DUF6282 family protein n=1 Tax=Ectobacillus funiculus TaxID=137993 RepID=UPI00397BC2BC